MIDPWEKDRLGYRAIGQAFTHLVKSIDSEKVISIEAGFGRGKTFFRKAWAEHLRADGEVVVEVDVLQSDYSGDPLITLLGALAQAVPKTDGDKGQEALDTIKNLGVLGAKTVARAVLRHGADEVFEYIEDKSIETLEDFDALDGVIKDVGSEMSKAAGNMIASQMAGEKVRKEELPSQLAVLKKALTKGSKATNVVIIVDELDRCHPDYTLAFLEATKVVFHEPGYIFCLMINAGYLETIAKHRFGDAHDEEKYLDKFVDLRLKLDASELSIRSAVRDLTMELPVAVPFGETQEFSLEHAAELASNLAIKCEFSMRKVQKTLLRVEVALRCYSDRPLDASLLILLAFQDAFDGEGEALTEFLPRSLITPAYGEAIVERAKTTDLRAGEAVANEVQRYIKHNAPELLTLPPERYEAEPNPQGRPWNIWYQVCAFFAPHYIPRHREVLDAVAELIVAPEA